MMREGGHEWLGNSKMVPGTSSVNNTLAANQGGLLGANRFWDDGRNASTDLSGTVDANGEPIALAEDVTQTKATTDVESESSKAEGKAAKANSDKSTTNVIEAPDITGALANVLRGSVNSVRNMTKEEKRRLARRLMGLHSGFQFGSWDIPEIAPKGDGEASAWIRDEYPGNDKFFVFVDGKPFYAGSVNYVLFGHLLRELAPELKELLPEILKKYKVKDLDVTLNNLTDSGIAQILMVAAIEHYKGDKFDRKTGMKISASNVKESIAWAMTGFKGWGLSGSDAKVPAFDSETKGEHVVPSKKVVRGPFRAYISGIGSKYGEPFDGQDNMLKGGGR